MKTYDLIYKQGEHWRKIGVLIEKDNGKKSIKLDSIPLQWDGWATIAEEKEKYNESTNSNSNR